MKTLVCSLLLISFLALPFLAAAEPAQVRGENLLTGEATEVSAGDKGLVVIFMSAKCPCSNSHAPLLQKMVQDFPQFHFVAVHSNADEPKDSSAAHFQKLNLPLPILQDTKLEIADRFKASKTPHVFVLGPEGEILFRGGMTNSELAERADKHYLRQALTEIQAGGRPSQKEVRTLGCAIARGEKNVW